ncbi:GlxA family transcriptional regulator [Algihabitans albus]|uniref:GlxA family transcriptional regulator n=1 Tax=Algihabitans albus TaxID=2164067 RepID=UPI0013C2E359|nr:helix-turn-helix domain-containing protein [Algihabitans albus]
MTATETGPRQIGFLLIEGFDLSSFAGPAEAFALADRMGRGRGFKVRPIGLTARPVRARCGASLTIRRLVGESLSYDQLFVCAGVPSTEAAAPDALNWLRRCQRFGTVVVGLDTGVWSLARAGLLGEQQPYVAPKLAAAFAETFGRQPIAAFGHSSGSESGTTVVTAAGAKAALNLALELIARCEGEALAEAVAQELGHRRAETGDFTLPLSQRLGLTHPALARCLDAMEQNTESPLDKQALTEIAGLSARQLERLFLRMLGQTPGTFYRNLRLAHARYLLEHTALPVTEIAVATGFVSVSHFGRTFQSLYGSTPSQLRRVSQERNGKAALAHLT